MSGFLFGGPVGPKFELFSRIYLVCLHYEKTTTYITLLTYDWVWATNLCT